MITGLTVFYAPLLLLHTWKLQYPGGPAELKLAVATEFALRKSAYDWLALFFSALSAAGLIGTLTFTAWNFRISKATLDLTQESKLIEIYAKASSGLQVKVGEAEEPSTSASNSLGVLGSIYILGRVAASNAEYHRQIVSLICTFIKRNSPEEDTDPAAKEIQGAIDVLLHRRVEWDDPNEPIDLSRSNLSGVSFNGGHFDTANFSVCKFTGSKLTSAVFRNCKFVGASFINSDFSGSEIKNCDFSNGTFLDTVFKQVVARNLDFKGASGVLGAGSKRALIREVIPATLKRHGE